MKVIFVCPNCERENTIEVVGEKVEAATCSYCGTEVNLFPTAPKSQAIKS